MTDETPITLETFRELVRRSDELYESSNALQDAMAWAVAEIERLRAELSNHQESQFHPDWSLLEATPRYAKLNQMGLELMKKFGVAVQYGHQRNHSGAHRKALEHYADRHNWDTNRGGKLCYFSPGYEVAEEALRMNEPDKFVAKIIRDRQQERHPSIDSLHTRAAGEIERLLAENAKYRKALEHYRDRKNWDNADGFIHPALIYTGNRDGWQVAEEALRETSE